MEYTWLEYWRVEDGELIRSKGYMRDDYVIFDIDPEDHHQEQIDDEDPRMVHIDRIYEQDGIFEIEDEADAVAYAVKFMNDKILEYQLRLARLQETNTAKG